MATGVLDYSNEDTFQLTLPSNAKSPLSLENKPNSYRIELQKPIRLKPDRWEFALMSLIYPNDWYNVIDSTSVGIVLLPKSIQIGEKIREYGVEKARDLFSYKQQQQQGDLFDDMLRLEKPMFRPPNLFTLARFDEMYFVRRVEMPKGAYGSVRCLCESLCKALNLALHELQSELQCGSADSFGFRFSYDESTARVKLHFDASEDWFVWLCTTSPYLMTYRLGIYPTFVCNGVIRIFERSLQKQLFLKRSDLALLSFFQFPLEGSEQASLENPAAMFLYSDMVKHQLVGNTSAQLLTAIPLKKRPERHLTKGELDAHNYHVENPPYYMPVTKAEFKTVEVQLHTDWGAPFPFSEDSNNRVICRLHFRKRILPDGFLDAAQFII